MLRLLDHPCFWYGVHCVQGTVTDPCVHTSPSPTARPAIPSQLLRQPKPILHSIRAPQGFSLIHTSLSKVTHLWQGPGLFVHLKPSRSQLIKSSASGPNFCPWASATHLVPVWPSHTSLRPFVPQLDEVCCNISSSGSQSLTGNGSLPALPSNKVHLTLFNPSHWNLHAENYLLPTIGALKLLKFEVYVKTVDIYVSNTECQPVTMII